MTHCGKTIENFRVNIRWFCLIIRREDVVQQIHAIHYIVEEMVISSPAVVKY